MRTERTSADLNAAIRAYRRAHRVPRSRLVEAWRSSEGIYQVFTRVVSARWFKAQRTKDRPSLGLRLVIDQEI